MKFGSKYQFCRCKSSSQQSLHLGLQTTNFDNKTQKNMRPSPDHDMTDYVESNINLEDKLAGNTMVARPTVSTTTLEVHNLVVVLKRGPLKVARVLVTPIAVNDLEVRQDASLSGRKVYARLGAVCLEDTRLIPLAICTRQTDSNLEKKSAFTQMI